MQRHDWMVGNGQLTLLSLFGPWFNFSPSFSLCCPRYDLLNVRQGLRLLSVSTIYMALVGYPRPVFSISKMPIIVDICDIFELVKH
jgi:hypothetical protein